MRTPRKNALEWAVFWASLAIVGSTVAYLISAAATSSDRPPQLEVQLGEIARAPEGYTVALTVSNRGDVTAAEVLVEVLAGTGDSGERALVTLAFVPHGSSRRAWVSFRALPERAQLRARILGYEEP